MKDSGIDKVLFCTCCRKVLTAQMNPRQWECLQCGLVIAYDPISKFRIFFKTETEITYLKERNKVCSKK